MTNKEESQRKKWWIDKLNAVHSGWINGDSESRSDKTADIVNKEIDVAIELKTEDIHLTNNGVGDLERLSNKIQKAFKLANKKFKNYPRYKTILIIELSSPIDAAKSVLFGRMRTVFFNNAGPTSTGLRNINLHLMITEHIGAVVFWPTSGANKGYYFDNRYANAKQKVSKNGVEIIIGNDLEILDYSFEAVDDNGIGHWLRRFTAKLGKSHD